MQYTEAQKEARHAATKRWKQRNRQHCNEYNKSNYSYRRYVENGLCPNCGGSAKDTVYCIECKEKARVAKAKIKEKGYCPTHSNIKALPGRTYCLGCKWMVWESTLKTKYRITLEEYARMEYEQNRKCASCHELTDLVLDHDHKTGEVRALLCGPCNRLIGHAKENKLRLQLAVGYLERFQQEIG